MDDTMNKIYISELLFLEKLEQHQLRLLGNVSGESIRRIIKIHHYCHFSYCFNMEQRSSGANTETSRNFIRIIWRVRIEKITVYKSVKKVCIKDFTIKQWRVESDVICPDRVSSIVWKDKKIFSTIWHQLTSLTSDLKLTISRSMIVNTGWNSVEIKRIKDILSTFYYFLCGQWKNI